jgi:GNAT superfamily N-acetyltransferase
MEFPFSLEALVSSVGPGAQLDVRVPAPAGAGAAAGGDHEALMQVWSWSRVDHLRSRGAGGAENCWCTVVDSMGRASASAQNLGAVITSAAKFARGADLIYLHYTPSLRRVNALLRTGRKRLFIRDEAAAVAEIEPACVLDFYVHESLQRAGIGKQLFEFMLGVEGNNSPARYGYDRPSHKLLAFLSKHYALSTFVPQNNNFVVFRKYFNTQPNKSSSFGGAAGRGRNNRSAAPLPPHDQCVLNPRSQAAAGTRSLQPSQMRPAGAQPAPLEFIPSPRLRDGASPPRSHMNQQGGPVSRLAAADSRSSAARQPISPSRINNSSHFPPMLRCRPPSFVQVQPCSGRR